MHQIKKIIQKYTKKDAIGTICDLQQFEKHRSEKVRGTRKKRATNFAGATGKCDDLSRMSTVRKKPRLIVNETHSSGKNENPG